jgi:XapX domain-containing protein
MKPYILSLAAGLLVGIVYSLLKVRSPAPPVIALIGLLGILAGEQIPPLIRHLLHRDVEATTWLRGQVKPHVFGQLPEGEHITKPAPDTEAKS